MRILHLGDDFAALRPNGLTLYSDSLMQAQVAAGHDVFYVFAGRHYPRLTRPRRRRWRDRRVRMIELTGSPIHSHGERGSRRPDLDLAEPAGESAFAAALSEASPDVVHIHELSRLPSSIIDLAKARGVPVVLTLHDYKPLCASVRLLDSDGQRCLRQDVGEDCARNCAGAPAGRGHLVNATLDYELTRARRALPLLRHLDMAALAKLVGALKRAASASPAASPDSPAARDGAAPPETYQRRRDTNVARLSACDRVVAPSARAAEIAATLGVSSDRLVVQRLSLPHLERLAPRRGPEVGTPLTFLSLGGLASTSKGARLLTEAVRRLDADGQGAGCRLIVLGHIDPPARRDLRGADWVELRGAYDPAELDGLLDEGDVGIFPSVWEETHGFVGIEMLAKGLPVIANALGGMTEYVIEGRTGWLNRDCSGAGLAELMAAAIADPGEVERLRRWVREQRTELVRPMAAHVAEVQALYDDMVSAAGDATQAAAISSPAARRAGS